MTPAYVAEDIKTVYNLSLRFVQCNLQALAYTLLSVFSPRGSSIQMAKLLTRVFANLLSEMLQINRLPAFVRNISVISLNYITSFS